MEFGEKIFFVKLIYLISQVFCPEFFKFSDPLCVVVELLVVVVPNLLSLIDGVKCKGNSSMLPICPEPKDFSRINCCRTNLNLFERSSKWSGKRAPIEKSGLR